MAAEQTQDGRAEASLEPYNGASASRTFEVTDKLIADFADLSGDRSPIHVDAAFAQRRGLRSVVAHGALLGALTSCVLGMDLPGAAGFLQELSLKFHRPCYAGDVLTVQVSVTSVVESVQALLLKIRITNQRQEMVASGKAQSGVQQT